MCGIVYITLDLETSFLAVCVALFAHVTGVLDSKIEESVDKYRLDLFHFLTTDGDHCTGDAFKMCEPHRCQDF